MSDTYLPNEDADDEELEPEFLDNALPIDETRGKALWTIWIRKTAYCWVMGLATS